MLWDKIIIIFHWIIRIFWIFLEKYNYILSVYGNISNFFDKIWIYFTTFVTVNIFCLEMRQNIAKNSKKLYIYFDIYSYILTNYNYILTNYAYNSAKKVTIFWNIAKTPILLYCGRPLINTKMLNRYGDYPKNEFDKFWD